MKKPSFCAIVLAIVLGALAFSEIKDTITGDKQFFLSRWIHSNRSYAQNIEIKPYLLNDDQVAQMFAHPDDEIEQPSQKYLYRKNANLVLRMKNHGDANVRGTLSWRLADYGWKQIDIYILPPTRQKNQKYSDLVIPLDIVVLFEDNLLPDKITIKWNSLYTTHSQN